MEELATYNNQSATKRLTLDEMKSFLWEAATLLRGQIDAAGYKEYIFPLLFFKRISDVYDEQFDGYVREGGEEYANSQTEDFVIQIPQGAHWRDVREVTENVGQRLVEAFIAIEQANPGEKIEGEGRVVGGLDGIFGAKDGWTNKAKMPDNIITSLIEHFSKYDLNLAACPADEMGQAYEYLVGKFADDAGNTAQEFYTNRTVVTLMAEILQPQPDESIYDPTCGSGGMLVKCLDYLRQKGEPWQGVKVFGQEINPLTSSIARMNLYLNGVEDFSVVCADTLQEPAFVDGSQLRKFDIVLANPPYSIKTWNREAFMNDKWGRNVWGVPIQARADYAFIQHIVMSMNKKTGRSATLLPHGVLNREEDKEIRLNHVKSDTIDCIIGLGRNLFYNSGLESFIFICSNCKPTNRKGKVLFIDAEKCTHKQGKQAYLFPDDIKKIVKAYNSTEDIPGFSRFVCNDEIIKNEGNLNIKSYVKSGNNGESLSLNESLQLLTACQNRLSGALNALSFTENEMKQLEFNNSRSSDKSLWKRVKLSDVAEEYSIRVENPSLSDYDFYIGSDCIGQYDFRIHKKAAASTITSTQKGFKLGDYLLVRRSLYGSDFRERAPRADFDGVCSADILTIREKTGVVEDGFLIYVLYQKEFWDFIVSNSTGGLTRRIKWKQLADYEFELPPLETQRIIANKLWSAYRLKESYKRLLTATQELVKSRFIEMFGNEENHTSILSLCDTFIDGDWIEAKDQSESGVRLIQTGNIGIGKYKDKTDKARYISEETFERLKCTEVVEGDILISRLPEPVGRACSIPGGIGKSITAVDCTIVRLNDKVLPEFFIAFTNTPYYAMQIKKVLSGTTRLRISRANLGKIQVPLPSKDRQQQFVTIVKQFDKSVFDGFKSRFIEMFGNPVTNDKKWNTQPIQEVAPEKPSDDLQEGNVWLLNLDMIEPNTGHVIEKVYADSNSLLSVSPFDEGNVLFSKLRPYLNKVVIPKGKGYATTELLPLRPDEKKLDKTFFSHMLRSDEFVAYANSIATGTKMPRMPLMSLRKFECILPPMEQQQQFVRLAEQFDKSV